MIVINPIPMNVFLKLGVLKPHFLPSEKYYSYILYIINPPNLVMAQHMFAGMDHCDLGSS